VKEASVTTQLASELLGQRFEFCAEKLLDTLFKLLNSGTKTISEYGNEIIVKLL